MRVFIEAILHTMKHHRFRIHRCAPRGISCFTWMAWMRHRQAHFWQAHMQDFIRIKKLNDKNVK